MSAWFVRMLHRVMVQRRGTRKPPTCARVELLVTSFGSPPAIDREGGRASQVTRWRLPVPATTRSVDRPNPPWATRSASYFSFAPGDRAKGGA